MRIEHQIDIDAPVSRVWDLTLDVEAWPQHTPTMTSVRLVERGPISLGSQARIKQPGQPERTWTVSRLDHEKHFAWSTKALGTTMTGAHVLEPSSEGTRNTLIVDIVGPMAWLVGPMIRRPIRKAIGQENAGFKRAAESE